MKTRDRNWRMHEYEGKSRNLTEIARMVGLLPVTLLARINSGRTLEQALAMPRRRRKGAV
jgi:hypothetical protein